MKKKLKTVLVFGATSEMAADLIEMLLKDDVIVCAVSRSEFGVFHDNLFKYRADLSSDSEIDAFFKSVNSLKFDAVICFQGVAISAPVEFLSRDELQKQLNISLFSLLTILRNLRGKISKDGIVVYISSMASFGIFPFLSPYSMAKAAADIMLSDYEAETGIKTVSIKPGVVGTKFWNFCVKENQINFQNFKDEYEPIGGFLGRNALKNSKMGIKANDVAKLIYKVITSSHPRASYLIGKDAYFASFASKFKGRILSSIIRQILCRRIKNER